MNRAAFYDKIRPLFGGKITQSQVEGMEAILNEWEARQLTDMRYLAYILATVFHETARTMQPVREYGRGKGRPYGDPDPITGEIYYGRGWPQLTWKRNYEKMGVRLGIDLVGNPDLALQMDVSADIMFEGMLFGLFTGRKLKDYFNTKTDWRNARRIINGTDRADLIASYAMKFFDALNK